MSKSPGALDVLPNFTLSYKHQNELFVDIYSYDNNN